MGINTGALYIIFIMLAIFGFAYVASGPTPSRTPLLTGPQAIVQQPPTNEKQADLQLYNFIGATITPPAAPICSKGGPNKHPEALIAIVPPHAHAISSEGQIALWVSDTKPPYIAPNERISKGSGAVKTPGDRTAKAPDGYLLEPQLYIFPETVENGGRPYFPSFVRGAYNNGGTFTSNNSDVLPPYALPRTGFTVEFIWNVKDIGLTDGTYQVQFVAHDGNNGLGIRCSTIRVYKPPQAQEPQHKLPL